MMWTNLDSVYFVGIGGIGMSALARFFRSQGKHVAGYDRVSTSLTDQLAREDIDIHFDDSTTLIPSEFRDPERTLVIYTPAVQEDHFELSYFRKRGFRVIKRSAALGEVFNAGHGVAVAGTHGKTSVSTILAYLLSESRAGCNAFLGGISKNFRSNLVTDPATDTIIAEADEFDRSFLALFPQLAVVTSMDPDHLDIYHTKENLVRGFETFISQIHDKGKLILKYGLTPESPDTLEVFTYSTHDPEADYSLQKLERKGNRYRFTVKTPYNIIPDLTLGVPGLINVENALAALAAADQLGVSHEELTRSMPRFSGVERRFDVRVEKADRIYIDDYAHHPEELRALITSVREMYPGKRITGIFQPHLYSRTRDFAGGFAESLGLLDELILLDIYPAREEPIPGVSSDIIFRKTELVEKVLIRKEQLLRVIKERDPQVLLTMGAGDIDRLVEPLTDWMKRK